MPIVFFPYLQTIPNGWFNYAEYKAVMFLARIASDSTAVARLQSHRHPEFNLSAKGSLHSSQVLLPGMKTDKTMLTFHPKKDKNLKIFQKLKAQELLSATSERKKWKKEWQLVCYFLLISEQNKPLYNWLKTKKMKNCA